jgi:hypothetical protein
MLSNTIPEPPVNSEVKLATALDFIWGCAAIAAAIGRPQRPTYHLLESGAIKSAKRIGGRWVVSRAALLRELGA